VSASITARTVARSSSLRETSDQVELLITSLRCAAQLDPQIDVSNAVAKLADLTA
jgi:hypothetical protein